MFRLCLLPQRIKAIVNKFEISWFTHKSCVTVLCMPHQPTRGAITAPHVSICLLYTTDANTSRTRIWNLISWVLFKLQVKLVIPNRIRHIFEYNSHSLQMCTRISVIASNVDNKEVKVGAKMFLCTPCGWGRGGIFLVTHKYCRSYR
jgi:hypothetical protein